MPAKTKLHPAIFYSLLFLWAVPFSSASALTDDEKNNVAVYQKASPSVVNVISSVITRDFFLNPIPREGSAPGLNPTEAGEMRWLETVMALVDEAIRAVGVSAGDPFTIGVGWAGAGSRERQERLAAALRGRFDCPALWVGHDARPALVCDDVQELTLADCAFQFAGPEAQAVRMKDVREAPRGRFRKI